MKLSFDKRKGVMKGISNLMGSIRDSMHELFEVPHWSIVYFLIYFVVHIEEYLKLEILVELEDCSSL